MNGMRVARDHLSPSYFNVVIRHSWKKLNEEIADLLVCKNNTTNAWKHIDLFSFNPFCDGWTDVLGGLGQLNKKLKEKSQKMTTGITTIRMTQLLKKNTRKFMKKKGKYLPRASQVICITSRLYTLNQEVHLEDGEINSHLEIFGEINPQHQNLHLKLLLVIL